MHLFERCENMINMIIQWDSNNPQSFLHSVPLLGWTVQTGIVTKSLSQSDSVEHVLVCSNPINCNTSWETDFLNEVS
jgi:hypothetical protein